MKAEINISTDMLLRIYKKQQHPDDPDISAAHIKTKYIYLTLLGINTSAVPLIENKGL